MVTTFDDFYEVMKIQTHLPFQWKWSGELVQTPLFSKVALITSVFE